VHGIAIASGMPPSTGLITSIVGGILHIDELSYIDHACLVAIGDYERQCRTRGGTCLIDWVSLDARSEKVTPVVDLQPSA